MARADKVTAVAELAESFRSSQAAVLTEYRGLTVAQLAELREKLDGVATYSIVKNTLTKIAAREAGVVSFDDLLVGPSAIAFIQGDPVLAAKGLRDFARTHPLLVIKGGVLEGAALDPQELSRLADLDSREVLLAKLAGAMKASLSGAAALFQAPLSKAIRTIEALRAKLEQDPRASAGSDEPVAVSDEPPTVTDEPVAETDEPAAAAGEPVAATDETESAALDDTAADDGASADATRSNGHAAPPADDSADSAENADTTDTSNH